MVRAPPPSTAQPRLLQPPLRRSKHLPQAPLRPLCLLPALLCLLRCCACFPRCYPVHTQLPHRASGADSSYNWQSAVVVDHDYVGSSEASTKRDPQELFSAKEALPAPDDDALLKRDHVLAECKSSPQPECTNPDFAEMVPPNPEHWPAAYWTLQNKMEVT